jgi:hypothetical protein
MLARRAEPPIRPAQAGHTPAALSVAERAGLAAEILRSYVLARRALRRDPIVAVLETLRSQAPSAVRATYAVDGHTLDEARRLGRAVVRTLALLPGDTRCLVRSLVLTRLLARRGISTRLVIGARAAPKFVAHAWVEYAGSPVLSPGDGSFGRLVEL